MDVIVDFKNFEEDINNFLKQEQQKAINKLNEKISQSLDKSVKKKRRTKKID